MSRAYRLLFEVLNPHYFYRLREGIEVRKVLKETDRGSWVEKEEIWGIEGNKDDDTPINAAYTHSGDYLGDPEFAKTLAKKGITQFEKTEPDHCVCSIGFNPEEKKWYGWSHRAMYGFGVGSKVKIGDCGYTPKDADDFINQLKRIYKKHEFKKDVSDPDGKEGVGVLVTGTGPKAVTHFEPYPQWGKGEWEAKTIEDAKQMAIDFAKSVS